LFAPTDTPAARRPVGAGILFGASDTPAARRPEAPIENAHGRPDDVAKFSVKARIKNSSIK
jgi:hypothetical protein